MVVQFAKSSGMRFSLAVATGSVTQLPTLGFLRKDVTLSQWNVLGPTGVDLV